MFSDYSQLSRRGLAVAIAALTTSLAGNVNAQDEYLTTPKEYASQMAGTAKKYDGWYNLGKNAQTIVVHGVTRTNIPAFTGSRGYGTSHLEWLSPFSAQFNSGGTAATLNKITNNDNHGALDGVNSFNADGTLKTGQWAGTPPSGIPGDLTGQGIYAASGAMYAMAGDGKYNQKGGTLGIFEANPVGDLSNVVFQLELGTAFGYDLVRPDIVSDDNTPYGGADLRLPGAVDAQLWGPTIHLTFTDSSTLSFRADLGELLAQEATGQTRYIPELDLTVDLMSNLYGFQWDLSGYSDIESFAITFDFVDHVYIYAMQLDQSNEFNPLFAAPIPEPSTYALIGVGLAGAALLRRRRQTA